MNRSMWLSASRGAVLPIAILVLVGVMVVPIPAACIYIG
jgi:flagellar biosynthesis protein FlhA